MSRRAVTLPSVTDARIGVDRDRCSDIILPRAKTKAQAVDQCDVETPGISAKRRIRGIAPEYAASALVDLGGGHGILPALVATSAKAGVPTHRVSTANGLLALAKILCNLYNHNIQVTHMSRQLRETDALGPAEA
jgi:hypothetical protein